MAAVCPECGATLADGGSCQELFHGLLLLEAEIPGGPGALAHFYAVATYGLQHPTSMNYTSETMVALLTNLSDALAGRATIEDIRRRTSRATNGAVRVTRRPGDPAVAWRRGTWPMTIIDILAVQPEADAYGERVTRWARSVCETLGADRS